MALRQLPFTNPVRVELLAAWLVGAFVSMSPEVVALSLQQIRWQTTATVAVIVRQCGTEAGHRQAELDCGRDDSTPRWLSGANGRLEEVVQQQIFQRRIFVEGFLDIFEEA